MKPVPAVSMHLAMPDERLRPFIPAYWEIYVDGEGIVEDLLRPEWSVIRITHGSDWSFGPTLDAVAPLPDRAIIHGVAMRSQWVRGTAGYSFNIPLFPMAWHRLLGTAADRFAETVQPVSLLLGDSGEVLVNAVLGAANLAARAAAADAFFLKRLARTKPNHVSQRIESVARAVADPACASVAQLAQRTGLSQPQLSRLTLRHFGFLPKKLIRRERFLRTLSAMKNMSVGEWPDFLDPQYTDQSHMIRDFKYFIGLPPTHYFAMERPLLIAAFKAVMNAIASGDAEQGGLRVQDGQQVLAFRPDQS